MEDVPAGEQARAGMSRLPLLPCRVPTAAARLSQPEDPRNVAEALYEEFAGRRCRFYALRAARPPDMCYILCSAI